MVEEYQIRLKSIIRYIRAKANNCLTSEPNHNALLIIPSVRTVHQMAVLAGGHTTHGILDMLPVCVLY